MGKSGWKRDDGDLYLDNRQPNNRIVGLTLMMENGKRIIMRGSELGHLLIHLFYYDTR